MSREWNWVFDFDVNLGSQGSFLLQSQAIAMYVKNRLVSLGGWEVVGSSCSIGSVWEFEGVTGGGSYGGQSTGPYDVWSSSGLITWALNGSRPSFVLLKSPLWQGKRMYLLIGMGSGNSYYMPWYYAASSEMLELVSGDVAYYPVAASDDTEYVFFSEDDARPYYWYGTMIVHLSVCTDNGSFVMTTHRTGETVFHGIAGAIRMDPRKSEPSVAIAMGHNGNGNFSNIFTTWWRCWPPTPQTWNTNISPLIAGYQSVQWAEPMRQGSVQVMVTDLPTVNCFGDVDPFPFYLVISRETGNIEYKPVMLGRVPDMWIAPFSLADRDTVGVGATIEYYVCGYWLIPGNSAPTTG